MNTTIQQRYRYTALFCEENIWWLCHSLIGDNIAPEQLTVVFISNPGHQVAVFNQKIGQPGQPVIWDYHTLLLRKMATGCFVYDFDSCSDFPCDLETYLVESFHQQEQVLPQYRAWFRLIDSTSYLASFSSDRSHMHGIISADQFPDYPPIKAVDESSSITLQQYINFNRHLSADEQLLLAEQLLESCTCA